MKEICWRMGNAKCQRSNAKIQMERSLGGRKNDTRTRTRFTNTNDGYDTRTRERVLTRDA